MPPKPEIELKLEVPVHFTAQLARRAREQARLLKPPKPSSLVSVYYDTDKQKLRNKGLTLRVRRINGRYLQTVKQDGEKAALLARPEWERQIRGRLPDLAAAPALKPFRSNKLRDRLKPIFETRMRRTVYPVHSGRSDIELSLDKGTIKAGRRSTPLCELELELKRGDKAEVYRLARALAEEFPLQLSVKTKADRGYALLANKPAEAAGAAPVTLGPDFSTLAAFQAIAHGCLHQLVANLPAIQRANADGLHQSRVAMRRLRAAISIFSGMLGDWQTENLKMKLKWLTRELAPARELDVFIRRVVKPVATGRPGAPGMGTLTRDLRRRRALAVARAKAAVESQQFRMLIFDLAEWIEAGGWTESSDDSRRALRDRPIAGTALDELHRRGKKIIKKGRRLDELDTQARHTLRIRIKKLRYAAEFFADAFPGKKPRRRRQQFVNRLEKLQDTLGDLNDIAVHEELTAQVADIHDDNGKQHTTRSKKAFAAGRLSGREEARMAAVLKDARKAFQAFAKAKPFWS
jgi:inorganic triphosphatase YgiF